jgi:hypothetical protein
MSKKPIFRVIFVQNDKIFEMYAKHVTESDMFGFVVIEDLLFGEKSSVVVDPMEEKLKAQFGGVIRTYVPVQSVIRIDEVEKQGQAKMSKKAKGDGNISHFPSMYGGSDSDRSSD